jgi:two-component system cell cycle response regulator
MQGYHVEVASDGADGGRLALSNPPAIVVADLWMPGISGVQLCRLLKAEPATQNVPVVLRGPEGARNRFWAERAGAAEYVVKGRMGDLVRAMSRAIKQSPASDDFFTELAAEGADIRDRIAVHLDAALFESVLASEVRALTMCGAFDRLFDLLSQFVSQVTSYRWLALSTPLPERFGIHTHPSTRTQNQQEARTALGLDEQARVIGVEDEDAFDDSAGPAAIVCPIRLGDTVIGKLAMATRTPQQERDPELVAIIARELAGPIRMATLVEETQRLATVDALTGLMNRRAFIPLLKTEILRSRRMSYPLSCILFDIDHFKGINDKHGHASGDAVLAAMGQLLNRNLRQVDLSARWGGEEFVVAFADADAEGGRIAAERLRQAVEALEVQTPEGDRVPVTASFGLTLLTEEDTVDTLVDHADRAMYHAKASGRNRVVSLSPDGTMVDMMVTAPSQ